MLGSGWSAVERGKCLIAVLEGSDQRDSGFILGQFLHMQRLHGGDGSNARLRAPGEKRAHSVRIRAACVRVANVRGEEFEKADAGALAGRDDQRRRLDAVGRDKLVHGATRLAAARASTMPNRWLASTIISIASRGVSIGTLRCECGFLYEPIAPAKRADSASCSPASLVASVRGPVFVAKALRIIGTRDLLPENRQRPAPQSQPPASLRTPRSDTRRA